MPLKRHPFEFHAHWSGTREKHERSAGFQWVTQKRKKARSAARTRDKEGRRGTRKRSLTLISTPRRRRGGEKGRENVIIISPSIRGEKTERRGGESTLLGALYRRGGKEIFFPSASTARCSRGDAESVASLVDLIKKRGEKEVRPERT